MFDPGDVVVINFPGVTGIKRRPAVVLSSKLYHTSRQDVVVGILTSQTVVRRMGERPKARGGGRERYVSSLPVHLIQGGEYVEAMWLMLQQARPDDYVIGG